MFLEITLPSFGGLKIHPIRLERKRNAEPAVVPHHACDTDVLDEVPDWLETHCAEMRHGRHVEVAPYTTASEFGIHSEDSELPISECSDNKSRMKL